MDLQLSRLVEQKDTHRRGLQAHQASKRVAGNGKHGRVRTGRGISMWLGQLITEVEAAMFDIDEQNYGVARDKLKHALDEARRTGIVTLAKLD